MKSLIVTFFLFSSFAYANIASVKDGFEVLRERSYDLLAGKRVALITNHTGVTRDGDHIIDVMNREQDLAGFKLVALFSPEHGIRGEADEFVGDGIDPKTSLPIYSLYGKRFTPTFDLIERHKIDAFVFFIQDLGLRYYTFISTLGLSMAQASIAGADYIVLDRPSVLETETVHGPVLEDDISRTFASCYKVPMKHGLTIGEFALLLNENPSLYEDNGNQGKITCKTHPRIDFSASKFHVVQMEGYERSMVVDDLVPEDRWIHPSPNMRSQNAALLYSAIGPLEFGNLSVGRGVEQVYVKNEDGEFEEEIAIPFEIYGSPWLRNSSVITAKLQTLNISGVEIKPVVFVPKFSVFKNERCSGFQIRVVNRDNFNPINALQLIFQTLVEYPEFSGSDVLSMVGTSILNPYLWDEEYRLFERIRSGVLLY